MPVGPDGAEARPAARLGQCAAVSFDALLRISCHRNFSAHNQTMRPFRRARPCFECGTTVRRWSKAIQATHSEAGNFSTVLICSTCWANREVLAEGRMNGALVEHLVEPTEKRT
jgi:hypothetical protein